MSYNFKESAITATTLSALMDNRTKLSTEDVIKAFPDGVTINMFDIVQQSDGTEYPVFTISENDKVFYCGGIVLLKIAKQWALDYHGDITAASKALRESGGVKVKLSLSKTKNNNSITNVTIV